jgi:tRNA A-37 threonylcarbamoyl transferase component Bud32
MMRRAEESGVPVPHVHEVQPDALVMDRIEGPTMLGAIQRRPWRFERHAGDLGRLHRRVVDAGLNHGDFHPLNVLLADAGPVVIDWSNADEGAAERDVAFTYVILATSDADFPRWLEWFGRAVRRRFVAAYVDGVGLRPSDGALREAAERRLRDPHLRERELTQVRQLRARL